MLNRRHLRIKVLQAVYAFFQSDSADLAKAEKQLIISIDKIQELIIYQLSFLIEIRDFASTRIEESKKKYFPTEEDLDPNMKFVENRVLKKLEDNRQFRKQHDRLKINWSEEREMIRRAYVALKAKGFYAKHMGQSEDSFEFDTEMLVKLVKKVLIDMELLEDYYESKSIYWAFDTYYTSNILLVKLIKSIQEGDDEYKPLPELLKSDDNEADRAFMIELFRKTILHSSEYSDMIEEKAKNWELDRIALMDTILIKMALSELLEFPSIPVKVSLNEYIDISKYYSSEKSKVFINGILDKLIIDLKEAKKIKKTGRGLLEY